MPQPHSLDFQAIANARKEYVLRLHNTIAPFVLKFLDETFDTAVDRVGLRQAIKESQRALTQVPGWNSAVIRERTAAIEQKEPALHSLITAAFVSFVKILSSIRISDGNPKMKLKVPSSDTYVHRVFYLTAKTFYHNPKLLRPRPTDEEHMNQRWSAVYDAVENAVRDMLPMKDILSVYLSSAVESGNMVNPVLSPRGSDDEDRDPGFEEEEAPSQDSSDHEREDEPKVIPFEPPPTETQAYVPPQPQPTPQPLPPQQQPMTSPLPSSSEGFVAQPTSFVPSDPPAAPAPPPPTPTTNLFPDAEDGDEHFR